MQEENLIALLSETLKFYADPANYENDMIKKDGGHMARFALEQVKKLDASTEKLVKAFEEFQGKVTEKTPEEVQKLVNDLMNQK